MPLNGKGGYTILMTKPMKYRDLVKLLRGAGFTVQQGRGDHEKWTYPGIERPVVITDTRDVSPAVTKNALKAIEKKKQEDQA